MDLTLAQAREIRAAMKAAVRKPNVCRRILRKTWWNMMDRCYNKNCSSYRYYGGKGIGVEPSWHEFSNFMRDMIDGWREGYQLDRTDNKKDYSKDNCQWLPIVLHSQKTARDKKRESM